MAFADSFELDGLSCFQSSDDPAFFYYVPATPGPEVDSQNRPTLLMLISAAGASLQLGANWKATADQLVALRNELAKRHPEFDPAAIRLSQGATSVQKVTLMLGNGEGVFDLLRSSNSSGFPPYSAIFSVSLSLEQKDRAVAALNGRAGFLKITYLVTVPTNVSIELTMAGDVQDDLASLQVGATLADCRARVLAALADGRLTHKAVERGPVSEDMRQKALRVATEKAAGALLQMTRQNPSQTANTRLEVTAALTDSAMTSQERSTDVSSWFTGGAGPDHVKILPGAGGGSPPPPPGVEDPVRLAFDDRTDLPIAFVEIARVGSKALLRPPGFEPAALPRTDGNDPATVTTNYTTGGPPFKTTLSGPGEDGWTLALEQLGLQRVVVDATARREAGAKEIRVRIQYRPSGQGSDDDRTIYLRKDTWTAAFYEVTRSAALEGVLEFEWKETGADGSVKNGKSQTSDPSLKLT